MEDCLRNRTIRICLIGYLGAATRVASVFTDGCNRILTPYADTLMKSLLEYS
jgi:hypothetical protein